MTVWSTVKIGVSGKAFSAAIEGSSVPAEERWPQPYAVERRGRGYTHLFIVDRREAKLIMSHLREVGESFVNGDDPETRADGRACLAAAAQIMRQIVAADG